MSDFIRVTDPGDSRVDDFRDLTHADRRPDRPGGRGLVIAEGTIVVRRMLRSRYAVRALLGVERRSQELGDDLSTEPAPFYLADPDVMARIVGFHLNRGVLAIADRPAPVPAAELLLGAGSVAVLEGVGDSENLGSIFRNAAGLGVDAVLLGPGCGDPLYRRSVRVSMGDVLLIPFGPLTGQWPEIANLLHRNDFFIAALTPGSSALPLRQAGLTGRKVALLLGSEGPGLSAPALAAADVQVRVPMAAGVDSLNVATAGAIAFAELSAGG